ncbi:Lsr2 family protein [Spirillospora sp. NPDC052269]|uniref:Lsr2 family protein n=1 Tax=Actinomadura harenae TaxID=2483351 RepID=A0A3M2M1S8_9ACTN|nr:MULTISPECIES: Lsr2 family protein [Actinomadura]RMI43674.1 Lsr2 family protein [Actinomadura harenae]
MAQKTIVVMTDDLDGGDAEETVSFALDGVGYEIDLNAANAAKLRERFEPFVANARKAARRPAKPSRSAGNREQSAEIREWAKQNGIPVNDRGRIPAKVIEQYNATH